MMRVVLCLLGGVCLSGCALRYTDAKGRVHTMGMVWLTHDAASSDTASSQKELFFGHRHETTAPLWLEMKGAGVIVESTAGQRSLTLGYKDAIWVFPADDAVTDVDTTLRSDGMPHITVRRTAAETRPTVAAMPVDLAPSQAPPRR